MSNLSVTFPLHLKVDVPQVADEVIAIDDSVLESAGSPCRAEEGLALPFYDFGEKRLVPADGRVELIVGLLRSPGLVEAHARKGAREQSDGRIDRGDTAGIDLGRHQ